MEKINFTRILDSGNVENLSALEANSNYLKHPFVAESAALKKGGYIIFDFGEELVGRIHLVTGMYDEKAKISVRIRTGESLAEVCSEIGEHNACNNHSLRDGVYSLLILSDFSTTESGFRFARIDLVEGNETKLLQVFAEKTPNGLTKKGYFHSSDEKLNKIYQTAEKTISLCVRENAIWDGIKRDRLVWLGDSYPEFLSAFYLYGDIPQFRTVLESIKDFKGMWADGIPAYSAWWILCLAKYLEFTGNREFVETLIPEVEEIVGYFSPIVMDKGEIDYSKSPLSTYPPNSYFLDWPTNGTPDSESGWRYFLSYAMKETSKLLSSFGKDGAKADEIVAKLKSFDYKPSSFKQVNAFSVLSEQGDQEAAKAALKENGARGWTTFLSFAIVEALSKIGEGQFALNCIKEYYGAMLDMGATTFWEDFDLDWLKDNPSRIDEFLQEGRKNIHADYGKFCYTGLRHSLCHGWSTGFVDFFYRYLLGVIPVENGYKTIKIEPHLCGLTSLEGAIPTSFGLIKVKHVARNGEVMTSLELPEGVKVI